MYSITRVSCVLLNILEVLFAELYDLNKDTVVGLRLISNSKIRNMKIDSKFIEKTNGGT